jgi:hypothetical protein
MRHDNIEASEAFMNIAFVLAMLLAPNDDAARERRIRQLVTEIANSGRVLEIGEAAQRVRDPRTEIAPGAPPLLAFRYFQGADRHRFGKLDLMLDDAGH